jgi:hypothetical protein
MKSLITLLVSILFSVSVIAAPGGSHHKITAYDYNDYLNSDIQSKTFIRHQDGIDYDLAWYFDRPNPNEVVRTEVVTDAYGNITRYVDATFKRTAQSFDWLQSRQYDPYMTPPLLVDTTDYEPPVVSLTSAMVPGIAWGSGGAINSSSSGESFYTDKSEVLAVEAVTVPAGTFTGCLKIYRLREFDVSITIQRVEWYCPDMGLVKRIQGGRRMIEMTGVTFNE